MNDKNNFIPSPKDPRKLRDILNAMSGDDGVPENYRELPLYKFGFSDGKIAAEEEAKCLVRALTKLYDNEE